MVAAKKQPKTYQRLALNFLGGLGYLLMTLEWLCLLAYGLPRFFDSAFGKILFPKTVQTTAPVPSTTASALPVSPLMNVLAVVIAVAVVLLVLYLIFMKYIPAVAKTGSKAVVAVAEHTAPIISHKKIEHLPPKKRRQLTQRIVLWLKVGLAAMPPLVLMQLERGNTSFGLQFLLVFVGAMSIAVILLVISQAYLQQRWSITKLEIE
ncbi:MAG: hypothetical protein WAQ24_01380 [Candidatus Saccharimonadales bacterium]